MSFFRLLLLFLFIKLVAMGLLILYGNIGLGPDEAQYWTWSQQLDFGYYSKPPAIAWQIALGTHLFGNNEFGVRFASLIIGFLLPLTVYWLARECELIPKLSFFAALTMALTPLGFLSSLFAITDGGIVLFWTLACVFIVQGIKKGTLSYGLIGLCIALGALFKWQIYLLWIPILFLRKWEDITLGILLSLLGLLPSLIWNVEHDFATFRHVFATAYREAPAERGNLLGFIGAQIALASPIIFLMLLFSWVTLWQRKTTLSLKFCGYTAFGFLAAYTILACFKKIQGNWVVFAYPTAFVYLVWSFSDSIQKGAKLLIAALALSVALTAIVLAIPTLQTYGILQLKPKQNPLKQNMGVRELKGLLEQAGYDPKNHFLFSHTYQTTSLLSFYGPDQKRAYFFNIEGIRKNQFSYWPQMIDQEIGKTGYFVVLENEKDRLNEQKFVTDLQPYFNKVQVIDVYPLSSEIGKASKFALVIKAIGYNGSTPEIKINKY